MKKIYVRFMVPVLPVIIEHLMKIVANKLHDCEVTHGRYNLRFER